MAEEPLSSRGAVRLGKCPCSCAVNAVFCKDKRFTLVSWVDSMMLFVGFSIFTAPMMEVPSTHHCLFSMSTDLEALVARVTISCPHRTLRPRPGFTV